MKKYLTTIRISDKVEIGQLDEFNWTYRIFREVEEIIKGKRTGEVTNKWVESNFYYNNLEKAIKGGVTKEVELDEGTYQSLNDYTKSVENKINQIIKYVKENL